MFSLAPDMEEFRTPRQKGTQIIFEKFTTNYGINADTSCHIHVDSLKLDAIDLKAKLYLSGTNIELNV